MIRACARSSWKLLFAAILVAVLVFGSDLQSHDVAAHFDHVNHSTQQEFAYGQIEDCCAVEGEKGGHPGDAECSACLLPCATALQFLIPVLQTVPAPEFALTRSPYAQATSGITAAPDLRPPISRS